MFFKVVGKPKARRAVTPQDVPRFLGAVCGKQALPTLLGADLLETLVAWGLVQRDAFSPLSAL